MFTKLGHKFYFVILLNTTQKCAIAIIKWYDNITTAFIMQWSILFKLIILGAHLCVKRYKLAGS